jgi:hypothetical protein
MQDFQKIRQNREQFFSRSQKWKKTLPDYSTMNHKNNIEIGSGNPLLMSKTCPGSAST